jgi:cell division protein FtsA
VPKNVIAVLDIGSERIRAVIGEKIGDVNFFVLGTGDCEYAGYGDGKFFEDDKLERVIGSAVNAAMGLSGVNLKKIFVGVPSEFCRVLVQDVALAMDEPTRITDGVIEMLFERGDKTINEDSWENILRSPIYYKLDDHNARQIDPRGCVAQRIEAKLSYVLAKKGFVERIKGIFAKTGVLVELIPEIWAEMMHLFLSAERDRYALLADVGYISTSVGFMRGDGLLHLASFGIGGGHIAADIGEAFDVPFNNAEAIKERIDLNISSRDPLGVECGEKAHFKVMTTDDINTVARARIEEIGEKIRDAIARSQYDCPQYLTLFLTGGGISYIRGAKEIIASATGRSCEIIVPDVPQYNYPHYSSFLGLLDIVSKYEQVSRASIRTIFKNLFKK